VSLSYLLLTVFGLGRLRPAPGTWGSLPPVALSLGLVSAGTPPGWVTAGLACIAILATIACLHSGAELEERFGCKDPGPIVADEVAGQSIALLALPWGPPEAWMWNLSLAAAAFLGFRVMDIVKPPPARSLQRLRGGVGIVIDDLVAGAYTLIAVQAAIRLLLPTMV
jgi:phosphatidylglycerophosphatase A